MNKTELVAAVAEVSGLSKKDSEKAVKAVFDTISDELVKQNSVQLIGFGTFDVAERAEREGRNPQDGSKLVIPASKAVRFKVGKSLKDRVNA